MAPSTALARNSGVAESLPLPSLAGKSLVDILRLIRTPNVGPITFFTLLSRYGTVAEALDRLPELSTRGGRKSPLTAIPRDAAEKEIADTQRFGARFIVYGDPAYPDLLLNIPDPPPVITVMGETALWQHRSVAIVGARNGSANGCALAERMAADISGSGITVVSGLARGIDTFVHKGALAGGTVAVIAGGIDNIYPPENERLFKSIRERGAIISEQAFGTAPFASAFPSRNRIIAGMTQGTLVVEAALKSGSLITARLALEYSRDVFAVPGHPLDPRAQGCNRLLKQGAILVENAEDVISQLAQPRRLEESASVPFGSAHIEPSEAEMAAARTRILEKLGPSPTDADALLAQCALTPALLAAVLLEMELAGIIQRMPGNKVCLRV